MCIHMSVIYIYICIYFASGPSSSSVHLEESPGSTTPLSGGRDGWRRAAARAVEARKLLGSPGFALQGSFKGHIDTGYSYRYGYRYRL